MTETAIVFPCRGDELVGIVSLPAVPSGCGVLIIVGGPQYRVGSHRQYVHLARHLASCGIAAMRFDVRGMGDSSGAWRPFEDIDDDIGAAVEAMQRAVPGLRSVVLWGLCGGASAALLYWLGSRDERVRGMVLVNPWLRTETVEARARVKYYYLQRLREPAFWHKLFSGQVARNALPELLHSLRLTARGSSTPKALHAGGEAELGRRMSEGWACFQGKILLLLSENDHTAKAFLEAAQVDAQWRRNLGGKGVQRVDLTGADHTFTQPPARAAVHEASVAFASSLGGQAVATAGSAAARSAVHA